jgi:hypothetical protein
MVGTRKGGRSVSLGRADLSLLWDLGRGEGTDAGADKWLSRSQKGSPVCEWNWAGTVCACAAVLAEKALRPEHAAFEGKPGWRGSSSWKNSSTLNESHAKQSMPRLTRTSYNVLVNLLICIVAHIVKRYQKD